MSQGPAAIVNQLAGVYDAMNIHFALRHEVHHVPAPRSISMRWA